jgi:hypothetical protein
MTKAQLFSKKNLTIGGVSLLVVVVALGYFFVVPSMQVSTYKKNVTNKQPELRTSVNKMGDFLKSKTFVSTDTESAEITAEINKTRESIKDAEHNLSNDKQALSNFNALPLLGWNSHYKAATELKTKEQKYIADTESYIKELKATLDFMEKDNNLSDGSQKFLDEVDLASQKSETLPEYGAALEPAITKLSTAAKQYAQLKPVASMKAMYDENVKGSDELIALYGQLVAAAKANDELKVFDLSIQIQTKANEFSTKFDELNKKFVGESVLPKADQALKDQARKIEDSLAKL